MANKVVNYLNFGSLCIALREIANGCLWVPDCFGTGGKRLVRVKQSQVVDTVYSLLLTDEERAVSWVPTSERDASMVVRNLHSIRPELWELALQKDRPKIIYQNFEKHIYAYFDDRQRHNFLVQLEQLVDAIPDDRDSYNLKANFPMRYDKDNREIYCKVATECIHWCFIVPNDQKSIPSNIAFSRKPYDILSYDPYNRGRQYSKSGAIRMVIREDHDDLKNVLFDGYNFEQCLEYILAHNLVIKKIDCSLSFIDMVCVPCAENPYYLKRVGPEDYTRVRNFIFLHEHEYRTKKWWKDWLSNMVYNGLMLGKWTGYAYYNEHNDLVSYLDYKIRTDGDFELGTQLTVTPCRGHYLATGLINFMRFKFMNSCFFTGTYEENQNMKHIFEKAGFTEHLFYDPETDSVSNRIKERINLNFPDDDSKMTNSIYYNANSILNETRLGSDMIDSKTGQVKR